MSLIKIGLEANKAHLRNELLMHPCRYFAILAITSPPYVAIFNITCPVWYGGCNDACSGDGYQITDQCLEENQ